MATNTPSRIVRAAAADGEDSLKKYVENHFGPKYAEILGKPNVVGELLRFNQNFLGSARPRLVLAGPTFAGKSSLFNAVLKKPVQAVSAGGPDTTDYVAELQFGGLCLYDTPGIAGLEEANEATARTFLSIAVKGREPGSVVRFRVYGDPSESPLKAHLLDMKEVRDEATGTRFWDGALRLPAEGISHPHLVIVCFSLGDTIKKDVYELVRALREVGHKVLVVGTKLDKADSPKAVQVLQGTARKQLGAPFISVSIHPGHEETLSEFVRALLRALPQNTVQTLNDEISRQYRLERRQLIEELIRAMAARVAAARIDRKADELNLPELQAALFGLTLKMSIDFAIGGNDVRAGVEKHVAALVREISADRQSRTEETRYRAVERSVPVRRRKMVKEERKRIVPVQKEIVTDEAGSGGLKGALAGGAIGALAGPIGVLLGLLGGGLFGWAMGGTRKRRQFVTVQEVITEIVNVPREVIEYERVVESLPETEVKVVYLTGGARAAMAVVCFGTALYRELSSMEGGGAKQISTERFEKVVEARLRDSLGKLDQRRIDQLDKTDSEEEANALLGPLFPLPLEGDS